MFKIRLELLWQIGDFLQTQTVDSEWFFSELGKLREFGSSSGARRVRCREFVLS